MEAIGLFKLQQQIRRVLALNFPDPLFIKAEIIRLNSSRGHYYLELADKSANDHQLKAKAQAVIWKSNVQQLKNRLESNFHELLQEGLTIAFHASVQFHEVYGLKLVIEDIDLEYSLGVVAKERAEIIQLLEKEDLLTKNAQIALPSIVQRIAVISSSTAAGFSDFLESIDNNAFDLRFEHTLFPAAMQGLSVESEIISQLNAIQSEKDQYDAVVIIRGGGGKMDLAYFDNYAIAKKIAEMELPVFTGIGHQIDVTVTDLVANRSFKTPTAVAEFLIQRNNSFLNSLYDLRARIHKRVTELLERESWFLNRQKDLLQNKVREIFQLHFGELNLDRKQLDQSVSHVLERQSILLNHYREKVDLLDPKKVFERGYAAVEQNQVRIHSKNKIDPNASFTLHFEDGKIIITPNE